MIEANVMSPMSESDAGFELFVQNLKKDEDVDFVRKVELVRRGDDHTIVDGPARRIYNLKIIFEGESLTDLLAPHYVEFMRRHGIEIFEILSIGQL